MRIAVALTAAAVLAACSGPADSPAAPAAATKGPDWRIAQAESLSFIVADVSRLQREGDRLRAPMRSYVGGNPPAMVIETLFEADCRGNRARALSQRMSIYPDGPVTSETAEPLPWEESVGRAGEALCRDAAALPRAPDPEAAMRTHFGGVSARRAAG